MRILFRLLLISSITLSGFANAKMINKNLKRLKYKIDNSFKCSDVKTGTFCISIQKDIIINITARKREADDSLRKYKTHLEAKMAKTVNYSSKVLEVKNKFLNKVKWIYAKHQDSEFLGYYTQYFATVKGTNAYLVSISYLDKNSEEIKLISNTLKL